MEQKDRQQGSRGVARWLLIGVGMIIVQVVLGGITRLTGSGLSITEWQPLLGAIPPLNESDWQRAFQEYQRIGQYKQLHFYFTLADFKFIYFWEWFHRLWARLIALVFLIPFVYFIIRRSFHRKMIFPLFILFMLGGLQGALGWIMVKSGLNLENIYVSHIRLAIHFIAALGLLSYTLWFALRLLFTDPQAGLPRRYLTYTTIILGLLVVQFLYGAFMAGLKAAAMAPTWPTINGQWLPDTLTGDIISNPVTVQFIHRLLAYLITLLILIWWYRLRAAAAASPMRRLVHVPMLLILLQVILGICTVLYSGHARALLWLGAAHQFNGILLLVVWVTLIYLLRMRSASAPAS